MSPEDAAAESTTRQGDAQPRETLQKTVDYSYRFRGIHDRDPEGTCRVRMLHGQESEQPIMILTELDENASTSVTNMIEILAAELIAKHCPHRFEAIGEDPVTLIEHYPPASAPRDVRHGQPAYDRVGFASWMPRPVWVGGQTRLSLADPDWRHVPRHAVEALLGGEADDFPPAPQDGPPS